MTSARIMQVRRRVDLATPIQLAVWSWIAAALMVVTLLMTPTLSGRQGMMNLTESWGALERVALWQRSLSWIPGLTSDGSFRTLPLPVIVYGFRLGMILTFILQAWAFWQAWNGQEHSIWKWMIGPLGVHIILLLLVPTNADVFFYAMSGNIANTGANPYVEPLLNFSRDPFLPYNHWVEMTTVYGPLWTDINRLLVRVANQNPVATVYAFKILIGVAAALLIALVYKLTYHVTRQKRLATAAAVLVAWQPNMSFESTGQVHNDILMILLATAGVALAIYGGYRALRGAMVLIAASVMVKYLTLPLLGIVALIRLGDRQRPNANRHLTLQWIVDSIAILAVFAAGFLPYWDGIRILTELFEEPGRLFSHPLWALPYFALDRLLPWSFVRVYVETIRLSLQIVTVGLIAYAAFRLWKSLNADASGQKDSELSSNVPWWTGHLLVAFATVVTTLSLVPVNSHPWYWTWPVGPIAILVSWQRGQLANGQDVALLPRWFWPYVIGTALLTLIYNTRIVNL